MFATIFCFLAFLLNFCLCIYQSGQGNLGAALLAGICAIICFVCALVCARNI